MLTYLKGLIGLIPFNPSINDKLELVIEITEKVVEKYVELVVEACQMLHIIKDGIYLTKDISKNTNGWCYV